MYYTFDLEIAKVIPEGETNWDQHRPFGISCAAVAYNVNQVDFWQGHPQMTRKQCQGMVRELSWIAEENTIVTWNGCHFDFSVLAEESGMIEECARLALEHVDLMMIVTFTKGWYLSLQKAALGAGLKGKEKQVELSDGSIFSDMSGAASPALWAAGETDAVLKYLRGDVVQLLKLTDYIRREGIIQWTSNSGRPQWVAIPKPLTAEECFQIPQPNTSWMTNPPRREDFVKWMTP